MGFLVRAKTIVAQQLIMDCGARTATINELASWEEIRNQTVELLNKNQRFKSYAQTGKSISHGSEFFIDKEILSRCTQCGSCTRACPCCFCFTLHDEATSRSLHANSCMMHHVNNDIVTKLFEQRLRHKFVYLPTRYGSIGCTGCGECIDACVAQIDFRDILNMIFRK